MKVSRILFGLGVGAVAGFAVALRHRDNQSVKNHTIDASQPTGAQSELQREIENMKQSFNDILNLEVQLAKSLKDWLLILNLILIQTSKNYKATLKIYKIVAKILVITFQTISSLKLWQLSHSFFTSKS